MNSAPKNKSVPMIEIEEHFDRALALPKPERAAYLRQACQGKPDLEDEVLSLLESADEAPDFLAHVPKVEKAIEAMEYKESRRNAESAVFKPKTHGSYVLLRRLGVGGMAEIYHALARGEGNFEKHVAIKSIIPSLTNDETLRNLFEKEARVNSALAHANIAQVFDFFKAGENYFLAMEYVAGKNLQQVLNRLNGTRVSQPLACYIVAEVAKGLAYAHAVRSANNGLASGVIHQDISPKNIMCTYEGEVKIVDFGIAKARERMMAEAKALGLMGTPRYMSPEQAFGEEVDCRSDIFSVGLVLYELLLGKSLFRATEIRKALDEVRAYAGAQPALQGQALPEELTAILRKSLEANAENRYASAEELHLDLQRYLRSLSFESGYSRVGNFMQSLFSEEIEAERVETNQAIDCSKKNEKKDVSERMGAEAQNSSVIVPLSLEAMSMTLSRDKSRGRGPVWMLSRVQRSRTVLRWIVVFAGVGFSAYWLSLHPSVLSTMMRWLEKADNAEPSLRKDLAQKEPKANPDFTDSVSVHLLVPKNGEELNDSQASLGITFSWSAPRGYRKGYLYRLEVSTTVDFSKISTVLTTSTLTLHYRRKDLAGGKYFWRIQVIDPAGKTVGQTPASFFVYHPQSP